MSGCFFGPYVLSYDPPVDCEITVVTQVTGGETPHAWVYRDNLQFDVTGEVEDLGEVELDTAIYTTDCQGNVVDESHYPELYKTWRVKLTGAEPGEQLWVNWVSTGTVQPATGTCPADQPMPTPSCSGNYDGCFGGDDFPIPVDEVHEHERHYPFACNAGGSSAWLVGVGFALALARRGALGSKSKRRSR